MEMFKKRLVENKNFREFFRIPDMYRITFRFKSLIPTNFNAYMMTFCEEPMLDHGFENKEGGYHKTVYEDIGKSLAGSLKDMLSDVIPIDEQGRQP